MKRISNGSEGFMSTKEMVKEIRIDVKEIKKFQVDQKIINIQFDNCKKKCDDLEIERKDFEKKLKWYKLDIIKAVVLILITSILSIGGSCYAQKRIDVDRESKTQIQKINP